MTADLRAVFILGATASGKTDLAARLCERCNGEIISVDSVQIYRGMDIGSAKPSPETLRRYPHHLVDVLEPCETYSAAQFCAAAHDLVKSINARGALPILAGGTMFYFHAFEHGLDDLPSGDEEIRRGIDDLVDKEGIRALHDRLMRVDPETAGRINPNDDQRVRRAWEVCLLAGKPASGLMRDRTGRRTFDTARVCKFAMNWSDRSILHQRIEQRFDKMLDDGLPDEVCQLMLRGDLTPAHPAMRSVGYRQMWRYLCGEIKWDLMRNKSLADSRQLAKRQFTWMRSMPGLRHFIVDETSSDKMEDAAMRCISSVCG